jgi:hypothetical protein
VADRWYFDMPLAICLNKPLRSHWRWLTNAKLLVAKLHSRIHIGQVPLTMYYSTVSLDRPTVNRSLGPFRIVREYVQTTLTSLFGRRPQDPASCPWWLFIYLCHCQHRLTLSHSWERSRLTPL